MTDAQLRATTAVETADAVRSGRHTARFAVERALERIAARDNEIRAFTVVRAEAALAEADALDAGGPGHDGPLAGVPVAVKEEYDVTGHVTTLGGRGNSTPVRADSEVIRRLRAAGAVIVGKTAMPEFGQFPHTESLAHGRTHNPWDLSRSPGGSSGGSAAAVAAGMVPVAMGADGGGSIRIPASCCGLVGLKPSRGLVPDDVGAVDRLRMTTNGPMGRCVDDVAALLDALARPGGVPGTALAASREPVPRLRIGVILDPPMGETDPRVAEVTMRVADLLRAAGHHVELRPRVEGSVAEFAPIYQALIARVPVLLPGKLQPFTRWFREQGRLQTAEDVARRFALLDARGRGLMDGLDVLLTPTVPVLAPYVGAYDHVPPEALFDAVAPLGAFTAMSNVTGLPALSMPAGMVDGVPVGVQLIGGMGCDGLLLALGRVVEVGE